MRFPMAVGVWFKNHIFYNEIRTNHLSEVGVIYYEKSQDEIEFVMIYYSKFIVRHSLRGEINYRVTSY